MLFESETIGMQREESSSELNDQEVDHDDQNPDDQESGISEESIANVELVMDLSSGKHVNNLEPDEQVEDKCHVTGRIAINSWQFNDLLVKLVTVNLEKSSWEDVIVLLHADRFSVLVESEFLIRLGDHVLTSKEEDEEYNHLEERHVEDVFGHLTGDNKVISDLRGSFKEFWARQFSREGEGSQRVHDHVNPEELNGLQGRFLKENSTNDCEQKSSDVDGELELQEALDVVVDVTTPGACLDNLGERIIHDDNVSGGLANVSASNTHAESDISLGEGRGIVGTITGHSNDLVHVHETSDKKVFVLRARTGHNSKFTHKFLELSEVLHLLLAVVAFAFAVVGAVLLAICANKASHLLIKLRALNANEMITDFFLVNDATFLSDGLGCHDIVTGNHADGNTSFLASCNCAWNLRADDVVDTEDGNESDFGCLDVLDFSICRLIVQFAMFEGLQVAVSNANCSQSLLSVGRNDVLDLLASIVLDRADITFIIQIGIASSEDQLRGSLDKESLVVISVASGILNDSGHSLTAR